MRTAPAFVAGLLGVLIGGTVVSVMNRPTLLRHEQSIVELQEAADRSTTASRVIGYRVQVLEQEARPDFDDVRDKGKLAPLDIADAPPVQPQTISLLLEPKRWSYPPPKRGPYDK